MQARRADLKKKLAEKKRLAAATSSSQQQPSGDFAPGDGEASAATTFSGPLGGAAPGDTGDGPVLDATKYEQVSIQPRVNRVVQPAEATILNTPARRQATEKEQQRRKRLQELGEKSTGRKRLRLEDEEEEAWALPGGFHRFAGLNKGAVKQQHQQQDQAPGGSKFGTAYATHDEHGRRIKHDPTQAHSVVAQELAAQKEFCVFERLELETENWSYRWLAQPGLGSFARQQTGTSGATPGANFGIVKRLLDRYPISDAVQGENFAETSNWMAQTNATLDYYEYAPPDIPAGAPYGSGGGGASSSRSLGRQPTDNAADGGAVEGAGVTQVLPNLMERAEEKAAHFSHTAAPKKRHLAFINPLQPEMSSAVTGQIGSSTTSEGGATASTRGPLQRHPSASGGGAGANSRTATAPLPYGGGPFSANRAATVAWSHAFGDLIRISRDHGEWCRGQDPLDVENLARHSQSKDAGRRRTSSKIAQHDRHDHDNHKRKGRSGAGASTNRQGTSSLDVDGAEFSPIRSGGKMKKLFASSPASVAGSPGAAWSARSKRSKRSRPRESKVTGGQNDTELEQEPDEQMQAAEMFCCVERGMTVLFRSDTAARASPTGPEFRDLLKKHQVPFFCDAESQDVDIHHDTSVQSSASATTGATSSTSRDFRKLDRGNRAAVDLLAATQRDTTVYVKGRGAVAAFADVYRMRSIRLHLQHMTKSPLPRLFAQHPFLNACLRRCTATCFVEKRAGEHQAETSEIHHTVIRGVLFPRQVQSFLVKATAAEYYRAVLVPERSCTSLAPKFLGCVRYRMLDEEEEELSSGSPGGSGEGEARGAGGLKNLDHFEMDYQVVEKNDEVVTMN